MTINYNNRLSDRNIPLLCVRNNYNDADVERQTQALISEGVDKPFVV